MSTMYESWHAGGRARAALRLPLLLALCLSGLASTARAADTIYWASEVSPGSLRSGPLAGGVGATLGSIASEGGPCGVAIAGGKVYWANFDGDNIRVADLGPPVGSPTTLFGPDVLPGGEATTENGACGVAIAGGNIYWANYFDGTIRVGPLGGHADGAPTTLFSFEGGPSGVAIAGGNIYWTNQTGHQVRYGPLGGGTGTSLYGPDAADSGNVDENNPLGLAIAGDKIYWADLGSDLIRFGPLDGSSAAMTLFGPGAPFGGVGGSQPFGVTIDPGTQDLYWGNWGSGQVMRGPLSATLDAPASAAVPLLTGETRPNSPVVQRCGDGLVIGTEECDAGVANGSMTSCCTASCEYRTAGESCRPIAGVCDVAELCTGSDASCPADDFEPGSTVCRPSAGVCDVAENCTGSGASCPADGFQSSSTVCRPSAGVCDVAENCTGSGASCPADGFQSSSTVCRPSAGVCDVAENCTGSGASCPADGFQSSSTVCRPSAGVCDVAENCTGSGASCPADGFQSSSTVCRPSAGVCDVAENCTGSGASCPADGFQSSSTVCRPSAGICDVAENCTGSGATCPADAKSTAVCRAAAGVCDVAESCDGVGNSCPTDGFAPASTVCRPAAGACDVAENCTGSGASCPADTGLPDTDGDTVCDALDNCVAIANPSQANGDGDALGDACDPCNNIVPTGQEKAKLTLTRLLAPPSDDKVSFKGYFTNVPGAPTIDPVANGMRFLITDSTGSTPVDVTIPGGAYDVATKSGWKVNGSGTSWTYKNAGTVTPLINGIQKMQLKAVSSVPGKYKVGVKGKNGSYPINPANLPLVGTIVIDVPYAATGQCGEAQFPAAPPAKPSCVSVSGGKTVKCK